MSTVIKVENLSKQYRLGMVGTGSLSDDINRIWHRLRGKEDPYLQIGEVNDRTVKGNGEYIWSLKDVNFTVEKGEAVGIVGRNGAGKSTLLKILSKVTSPTTGLVKAKGRIASLLEVGTGFHPELSGRENIYLNGAILGMRKSEIKRRFDEIVDFAGVERYIDTPVKRYSSGMYVRLAFAVAAYLESEILIVDEVLAVGDAEFQKKCLGKMGDVSKGQGRTVLFVSHNMGAVRQLCKNSIFLENGTVTAMAPSNEIIKKYLQSAKVPTTLYQDWSNGQKPNNNNCEIQKVTAYSVDNPSREIFYTNTPIRIDIHYKLVKDGGYVGFCLVCFSEEDQVVFSTINNLNNEYYGRPLSKGNYTASCNIPKNLFNTGVYKFRIILFSENHSDMVVVDNVIVLEIQDSDELRGDFFGRIDGFVRPYFEWQTVPPSQYILS